MTLPSVVMCSLWRNDTQRCLSNRAAHLLAKAESYPNLKFIWVVGDSTDGTTYALAELSRGHNAKIIDIGSTGIQGEDVPTRLRRLSYTANEWWHWVDGADYVLVHESDIVSPPDVVNRLVAHALDGRVPIAGWPVLNLNGATLFYDSFCYRKDGVRFTNHPPYHACYRPDAPFEVDSFGTMYLFRGEDVPLVHFEELAVMDLCKQLRAHGRRLWVDPTLVIEQPRDLWTYYHAP